MMIYQQWLLDLFSVFEEDGKFYPKISLHECLHEL